MTVITKSLTLLSLALLLGCQTTPPPIPEPVSCLPTELLDKTALWQPMVRSPIPITYGDYVTEYYSAEATISSCNSRLLEIQNAIRSSERLPAGIPAR